MKRIKDESDNDLLDDLLESFDCLKCLDAEDEYDLLLESCNNPKNQLEVLKIAESRYKRYLKGIDMTDMPLLKVGINAFLEGAGSTEYRFNLMKSIDVYIIDLLKKIHEETSHKRQKSY